MQSANLIPADAVAEPEPPPDFPEDPHAARARAELTTEIAAGSADRGIRARIVEWLVPNHE
jgi:hypothetical protein